MCGIEADALNAEGFFLYKALQTVFVAYLCVMSWVLFFIFFFSSFFSVEKKKKEREIKTTAVFSHAALVSILQSHMISCPGGVECGKVSKYVSQFFFFFLKRESQMSAKSPVLFFSPAVTNYMSVCY